MDEMEVK